MPLAEDDDMVKAFPPDRANQPFRMPIPLWRAGRGWPVTNAHGIEFAVRTGYDEVGRWANAGCRVSWLTTVSIKAPGLREADVTKLVLGEMEKNPFTSIDQIVKTVHPDTSRAVWRLMQQRRHANATQGSERVRTQGVTWD